MKCKRAQQRGWMRLVYGGDWRRQVLYACGLDGVWAETVVASVSKSGLQMLARSVRANKKRETRPETTNTSKAQAKHMQRHKWARDITPTHTPMSNIFKYLIQDHGQETSRNYNKQSTNNQGATVVNISHSQLIQSWSEESIDLSANSFFQSAPLSLRLFPKEPACTTVWHFMYKYVQTNALDQQVVSSLKTVDIVKGCISLHCGTAIKSWKFSKIAWSWTALDARNGMNGFTRSQKMMGKLVFSIYFSNVLMARFYSIQLFGDMDSSFTELGVSHITYQLQRRNSNIHFVNKARCPSQNTWGERERERLPRFLRFSLSVYSMLSGVHFEVANASFLVQEYRHAWLLLKCDI